MVAQQAVNFRSIPFNTNSSVVAARFLVEQKYATRCELCSAWSSGGRQRLRRAVWRVVAEVEEGVLGMHAMQKIPLASACGLPDYTNFTLQFQGCLDYIFFDYSQLVWEKAVPMPAHEQVVQEVALPSTQFPSDHVAQVATLRWL